MTIVGNDSNNNNGLMGDTVRGVDVAVVTLHPLDPVTGPPTGTVIRPKPRPRSPLRRISHRPSPRVRIAIEGGIGVGKSTLLETLRLHFADDTQMCFHTEPVEKWIQSGLLGRMYSGAISKLAFQVIALNTRYGPLARSFHDPHYNVFITERSLGSDMDVFARVNLDPVTEWPDYKLASDEIQGAMPTSVREVTIFLDASDEEVMNRIHERQRDEEKAIPMEYLALLRKAHDAFYTSIRHEKVRVDSSRDASSVAAEVVAIVERIRTGLGSVAIAPPVSESDTIIGNPNRLRRGNAHLKKGPPPLDGDETERTTVTLLPDKTFPTTSTVTTSVRLTEAWCTPEEVQHFDLGAHVVVQ